MPNPSRNSPCPCGSGKRFKHCCGGSPRPDSDASDQAQAQPFAILNRALELQQTGREEEAAQLYESILAIDSRYSDAHNMLTVIRAGQWRMAEAMHHANMAGALTNWSDSFFSDNYVLLMRKALGNVEHARFAETRARYLKALDTPSAQPAIPPTISILFFEQAATAELGRCLKNLAKQSLQPHEVLVAADSADLTMSSTWPFPVRMVDIPLCPATERINRLANAATGEFILALRKGDVLLPDHLSRLAGVVGVSGRWAFARNMLPQAEAAASTGEPPTAGFSLLSRGDRLVTESNLLVPRELHRHVGGYDPACPAPLLEYCLRLLWEMEPAAIQNETCMPGSETIENSADRLTMIGRYLDKAFSATPSPNPFAPTKLNWGFRLYLHIASQELFVGTSFMAAMNKEIEEYLAQKEKRPIQLKPGINLIGLARGELGLGENMRAFARASLEGGIPCAIRDFNIEVTRRNDASLNEHFAEEACHNCSIFFANPDLHQIYSRSLDAVVFERPSVDFRHIKIGYWFWELEKVPAQWDYAFDKVDEIWVATEFIATAMRRVTDKPVTKIPTPIVFGVKGRYDRNYFGLPANTFLFLFGFDFHSFAERKNPYALIRAFQRAFPRSRQDVALVIKSVNGLKKPEAMRAFLEQAGDDPRILLRNEFMSRDEVYGLQSVVDAYVSLHRAEGLGLGLAECMYQGKPVIGTAYSGNLEFMNEANSGLVNYSLAPIRKGEYLYDDPGFFWAEPDEGHAAYLMAKLVDDATYRNRIAAQGREDIRRGFNYAVTAERMKSRLLEIGVL